MNAVEVFFFIYLSFKINACWVEAIKSESKGRVLNENFDFNPKHRNNFPFPNFLSYCIE